jgi:multicomponent Na+:H+ antiporter subunit E
MTYVWAAAIRGAGYLAFWVVLMGTAPSDIGAGVVTAALAAWVSLRLIPPVPGRVRLTALARLAVRFAWQSVIAGWDVACRALDPKLPLAPGFVEYPCAFAPGLLRNAFAALTSLMPGTVPLADDGRLLRYHCLDVNQTVAESLGKEEARVARILEAGAPR